MRINAGANVNPQEQKSQLMLAIQASDMRTIQTLLEAGADMFELDDNGHCALGEALYNKLSICERVVKAVLDNATVESLKNSRYIASDEFHRDCPLYHFISLKNPEITRILLEKGSPVDAVNPITKETALHVAVTSNFLENVKLLLEYNANVNAVNQDGQTPLPCIFIVCCDKGTDLEMIKILLAAGAKLTDSVSQRIRVTNILKCGTKEMIRSVFEYPIDLNFKDKYCMTAVHYLAENTHRRVMKELPNFDFDVNSRGHDELTPLIIAARVGNPSSIKFLLNHGANVNAVNVHGKTSLFFAANPLSTFCSYERKSYVKCVEILIESGANPYVYSKKNINFFNFRNVQLIMPILAKVAVLEMSGEKIDIFMENLIGSQSKLKESYNSLKRELVKMKQVEIVDSITLFDFLAADGKEIYRFVRNKNFILNLFEVMEDLNVKGHYFCILERRFEKFHKFIEWEKTMLLAIDDLLIEFYDRSILNVAEQIVAHLVTEQWRRIV